ncbi:MAG: YjgP/YjgQ family permease, partial [Rhodothermales bacterium]|nr:YjgP/YjgQ family permease [Rhodothermales bacterium]
MKQFHRMSLRMLPGPFFTWLLVLLFLLVMQFLIKYLPELVGKGLPLLVIGELVAYNLAYMFVLAVPMSVLIAALMTYGSLAESNAYSVMKSAGASFPQLVWPALLLGLILTGFMWYFNTVIHPEANFRARNLWQDIRTAKPGFDLQPGEFYEGIDQYEIMVGNIPPGSPSELHDIIIYDYTEGMRFRTDITADSGRLFPVRDGDTLELLLFDGEIHRRKPPGSGNTDRYERLSFDRHLLRLSLANLDFRRTDPSQGRRTERTMKNSEMISLVDSLDMRAALEKHAIREQMALLGTGELAHRELSRVIPDRLREAARLTGSGTDVRGDESGVRGTALRTARAMRAAIDNRRRSIVHLEERADRYRVEIHKKYSIAVACFIFMMIGAPLGLAIRRGGLG